jgi:uncharacterized protein (TIGR02246 family)
MTSATEVQSAIDAAIQQFTAAFKRRDAAGIAALYTADGELLPPNSDFVRGTEAIAAFWGHVLTLGVEEANLETIELETHGDTAIEKGRYALKVGGGMVADEGKYLVVWKQRGGAWKLHRDIWSTNQPAPAPAGS